MLVLSRKRGELVRIEVDGHKIDVHVTQVSGGRVKLGFKCGSDVSVNRGEMLAGVENSLTDTRKTP